MSLRALLVTYHCVDDGPPPLCVDPSLFGAHLDALRAVGARTLTVSDLVNGMCRGRLPERAVGLTFDDGFASVAKVAAPLLVQRGMTATVFCVAGRLGLDNGWPTQHPGAPRRPLVDVEAIRRLIDAGFEVGSHGMQHAPLIGSRDGELEREVRGSRAVLERTLGVGVHAFAYPYGAAPSPAADALVRATYASACTTEPAIVGAGADRFALPRVDAHYLRSPAILRRVVSGTLDPYVSARRAGARLRRRFLNDHPAVKETV
jgi:peptidoglycan/xylan/chitin deacetylase (PgdA/CDA1 family)